MSGEPRDRLVQVGFCPAGGEKTQCVPVLSMECGHSCLCNGDCCGGTHAFVG